MPQPPSGQGDSSQPGGRNDPSWDTAQKQSGGGQPGEETSPDSGPSGGGQPGEDSWESGVPGDDDGWTTSNQTPGVTSDIPPMPSEQGGGAGQGGEPGEPGSRGELDQALEDFDGEILAEREVIRDRANESAANNRSPGALPGSQGHGGQSDSTASAPVSTAPGQPGAPSQRTPPPSPSAGSVVPDNLPDARDDDIIARQLREAAINETDPELKEKLWEEYRRYKGA